MISSVSLGLSFMTATSRQRLVPVGDLELCVEEIGEPGSPVILLVAGGAASMDLWDPELCERLAAGGRRVIRYDHRDTGRSTTGAPGSPEYGGSALDRDCVDLIDALGIAPVHLVGLSMGGSIAQSAALRRSEAVASLTLIATAPAGGVDWSTLPGPAPELAERYASPPPDPDWTDRDAYVAWAVDAERAHAGTIPLDEERARAAAGATFDRSINVAAANNHWIGVEGGDDEDGPPLDVHDIAVPTLVVHGTHDPAFPLQHGQVLAEAIPGAELLVVQGMGHQVPPPSTWDVVVPAVLAHTA